jgi:general secretion pathway protein G
LALVVLGILAAITIPTLLTALNKARQKRTMADLRTLGTMVEAYAVDNGVNPVGADIDDLQLLVPIYTDDLTVEDGWGHHLIYDGSPQDYTLGSTGRDGGSSLTLIGAGGPTKDLDADIVFARGSFVQWPEGTQE